MQKDFKYEHLLSLYNANYAFINYLKFENVIKLALTFLVFYLWNT